MRFPFILTVVVVLAGAASLLCCVEPVAGSIYPKCLFHTLTGLYCPGCGSTRCLHALVHGNLRQAAAFNVLLVGALPFMLCWGAGRLRGTAETAPARRLPAWVIHVMLGVILAYWALRNVPCAPFDLLAPHALP
jgi:hypothetical protein